MKWNRWFFIVDIGIGNMDSANEMSKGRIITERGFESVGCGLVLNIN